jgi:tol-pal system protein YbgF
VLERRQREGFLDLDSRIPASSGPLPPEADAPADAPAGTDRPPEPIEPAPLPNTVPQLPAPETATRTAAPPSQPRVAEAPPVAVAPGDPAKEQSSYQAAFDLLKPERREYAQAAQAFRTFLAQYPASTLADNAQYWLAESQYVLRDNDAALREFQILVERYPESAKLPGALLKVGYILDAQGQQDEARALFERVVRDHPGSAAAGMAKERLTGMGPRLR